MHTVSLRTAVKMTEKSESTIRRDVKKGKVSAERDARGHLNFDPAELRRVYGELKSTGSDAESTEQGNDNAMNGHDPVDILAIKDNQIADLRAQLEKSEMRETALLEEKSKLWDLLSDIQAEKRALMPPVDDKPKTLNWVHRLVGAR